MNIATIVIYAVFIVALTFNVVPVSMGLDMEKRNSLWKNLSYAALFGLTQGVMYELASLLGGTFLYLMSGYQTMVVITVFVVLTLVAVRMVLSSLRIRRSKHLYVLARKRDFLLLAVASSIDTFLVGLIAVYFQPFGVWMPIGVVIGAFIWSLAAIYFGMSKTKNLFASFVSFSMAVFILIIACIFLVTRLNGNNII